MERQDYNLTKHYTMLKREYGEHQGPGYIEHWIDHAIEDIKLKQENYEPGTGEQFTEDSLGLLDMRMKQYGFPEYVRDDVTELAEQGEYNKASRLTSEAILDPENEPGNLEILKNRWLK